MQFEQNELNLEAVSAEELEDGNALGTSTAATFSSVGTFVGGSLSSGSSLSSAWG